MKNKILFIGCFLIFVSCKNEQVRLEEKINYLYRSINQENNLKQKEAKDLIVLYEQYVAKYAKSEKSLSYLESKADFEMALKDYNAAINTYSTLIKMFPKTERAGEALFMQAFIYETLLNNKEKAAELYTRFLEAYPNHQLSDDAKFSLKHLQYSDEEILQLILDKVDSTKQSKI